MLNQNNFGCTRACIVFSISSMLGVTGISLVSDFSLHIFNKNRITSERQGMEAPGIRLEST
jgi:hypothetical protein